MKNIRMQYPLDATGDNILYDGLMHDIDPISLRRVIINNAEYFIMEYYDNNVAARVITVLTRIGNKVVKIPLDDYNFLFEFIERYKPPMIDLNEFDFPNVISLGETVNAESLFGIAIAQSKGQIPPIPPKFAHNTRLPSSPNKEQMSYSRNDIPLTMTASETLNPNPNDDINYSSKDVLDIDLYIPLQENWSGKLGGGIFRFDGIKEPQSGFSDKQFYNFSKSSNSRVVDTAIQQEVRRLPKDDKEIQKRDVLVDVPEGTSGFIYTTTHTGEVVEYEVTLIPGLHLYHITFAQVPDLKNFAATRMASKMVVETKIDEYRDLHEIDKVFGDACKGDLSIKYINRDHDIIHEHVPNENSIRL